jgi:hypothetical protein
LAVHLPVSKSTVIFNFISKVVTALGVSAFSFYFTDMGTEFVAKVK